MAPWIAPNETPLKLQAKAYIALLALFACFYTIYFPESMLHPGLGVHKCNIKAKEGPQNQTQIANILLKVRFIGTNNTKTESINSRVTKGQNNKQKKLFQKVLPKPCMTQN